MPSHACWPHASPLHIQPLLVLCRACFRAHALVSPDVALSLLHLTAAAALTSFQPDFESLSRALTEVLSGVQLPEPLAAMRGRAEADPAGRGPPPGQQAQGTAGGAEQQQQQPEGTGAGAVPRGIGGGGAGAAGRRATVAGSGLVDMTGASYGYRWGERVRGR